jgi:Alcohol dehydrogenase GroES-like domain
MRMSSFGPRLVRASARDPISRSALRMKAAFGLNAATVDFVDYKEAVMAKMRAVQVARAGGSLEFVERDVPEPARGEVRVSVEARGVCHSDSFTVEGLFPGRAFPRIPGHEIAGVIDALGALAWSAGAPGSVSAWAGLAGIANHAGGAG